MNFFRLHYVPFLPGAVRGVRQCWPQTMMATINYACKPPSLSSHLTSLLWPSLSCGCHRLPYGHHCRGLWPSFYVAVIVVSTVLWHPVYGLCCRQAAVFFQYLVGHSGPILGLERYQKRHPISNTQLYWPLAIPIHNTNTDTYV